MKEALSIETERMDDIPLLLTHMQRMQLAALLDNYFPAHGLRKGVSVGELSVVWLAHILSRADHRMNRVQEWGSRRLETMRGCGLEALTSNLFSQHVIDWEEPEVNLRPSLQQGWDKRKR